MTTAAMMLSACCVMFATGGQLTATRRLAGLGGSPVLRGDRRPPERSAGRGTRALGVAVIATACVAVAGPAAAVGVAGIVAWRLTAVRRRRRDRRRRAAEAIPEACRTLAAELSAGSTPAEALGSAAAAGPEPLAGFLRAVACAEGLGAPAASVLMHPPDGCEALLAVAVCWDVCIQAGAGLGPTMDRIAGVFAAELEAAAIVDAELAGVHLSAIVMACLPVFGLALGAGLGSDPLHFLLGTSAGRAALAVAALLDLGGLLWIGRLAARAAR